MAESIILKMTREQAYAVMQATELLGNIMAKDYCERRDRAKEAFDLGIKILMGTNAYGYPDVAEKPIEHERCWAVYSTIRYAIAWHDHPEGSTWSVAFDKPLGYGETMPKVEIREDDTAEGLT